MPLAAEVALLDGGIAVACTSIALLNARLVGVDRQVADDVLVDAARGRHVVEPVERLAWPPPADPLLGYAPAYGLTPMKVSTIPAGGGTGW